MTSMTNITWADVARETAFTQWLNHHADAQKLALPSLRIASADASFRRYFRIDTTDGTSRIIMDAPPELEDNPAFVHAAQSLGATGLNVPQILVWDKPLGFLLLTDLGNKTMLEGMDMNDFSSSAALYDQATTILVRMQSNTQSAVFPAYNHALLLRELNLFPDWYIDKYRGKALNEKRQHDLHLVFEQIIQHNLAAPMVYVHRDFMPRNLMRPLTAGAELGVLDFQDAVYGPISYDIASLMRDAFHSWDEEYILDVSIRYWEKAKKAGLLDYEDWHRDFTSFYRAVDWMAIQRHLKVAGIFARLTLRDGKPKYLADTPRFINYIRQTAKRYSELTPLLRILDEVEDHVEPVNLAFNKPTRV